MDHTAPSKRSVELDEEIITILKEYVKDEKQDDVKIVDKSFGRIVYIKMGDGKCIG